MNSSMTKPSYMKYKCKQSQAFSGSVGILAALHKDAETVSLFTIWDFESVLLNWVQKFDSSVNTLATANCHIETVDYTYVLSCHGCQVIAAQDVHEY